MTTLSHAFANAEVNSEEAAAVVVDHQLREIEQDIRAAELRVELNEVKTRIKALDKRIDRARAAGATPVSVVKRFNRVHVYTNRPIKDHHGRKVSVDVSKSVLGGLTIERNSLLVARRKIINEMEELS
jgi:hypothetical protein